MKLISPKLGAASNLYRCPCTGLVAPNTDVSNTSAPDEVASDSGSHSDCSRESRRMRSPVRVENASV